MQKKKIHLSLTKKKPRLGIKEHLDLPKKPRANKSIFEKNTKSPRHKKQKQMNKESYRFMDARRYASEGENGSGMN